MKIVTLQQNHIDFADKIAHQRQAAAIRRDRPAHNNAPTDPAKALAIHINGCRGEAAVYLFLSPVRWNAYREDLRGLADFEDWIDAKTCAAMSHRLLVQRDDPEHWAYVDVVSEHPSYLIRGWAWGHECKRQEYWDTPVAGRPAFCVRADAPFMKDPEELRTLLRQRQKPQAMLEHYCHCGRWAAFGYDVSLLKNKPGTWYCGAHRPEITTQIPETGSQVRFDPPADPANVPKPAVPDLSDQLSLL